MTQYNIDKFDCKTTHWATMKIKEFDGKNRWPMYMSTSPLIYTKNIQNETFRKDS